MSFRRAAELVNDPTLMAPPVVVAPPCAVAGLVVAVFCPPKGGKTTTACGMVAEASRAGVCAFMLTLDEPLSVTLQRLARFDADLERVWLDETFEPDTLKTQLEAAGAQMLTVDHIGRLAELNADFGANSQGDSILWGRLLNPFTTLARETGLAVVLLGQARRSDGKYAGSHAIAATVDLLCEMESRDGGLVCTPRGRVALPAFRVDQNDEGVPQFTAADGREPAASAGGHGVRDAALADLFRLLADAEPEGLKANQWKREAKETLGMSPTHFNRARRALLGAERVTRLGRLYRTTPLGETWAMPAQSVPSVPFGTNGTNGTCPQTVPSVPSPIKGGTKGTGGVALPPGAICDDGFRDPDADDEVDWP